MGMTKEHAKSTDALGLPRDRLSKLLGKHPLAQQHWNRDCRFNESSPTTFLVRTVALAPHAEKP